MSKKMMLLALSVVAAALLALPAVASATSAHIVNPESFTITSTTPTYLEDTAGNRVTCHEGVTGSGSFENTTTGNINLVFHGCTSGSVPCRSAGQPEGTIATTNLPFHLITPEPKGEHAGVLITPGVDSEGKPHFAHFSCTIFVTKTVRGNGIIGTITSPTCGKNATSATLSFEEGTTTGVQKHTTHTGVDYHLTSNGVKAAQVGIGQIHFKEAKTITCT